MSNSSRISLFKRLIAFSLCLCFIGSGLQPGYAQVSPVKARSQASGNLSVADLTLPKEAGHVEQVFEGNPAGPSVLLIQDAHSIPDAQRKIRDLILYFRKQYGIRQITLEGSQGPLDTEVFRTFPGKEKLRRVFEDYLNRGELTGGIAAAIFDEGEAVYRGIEDWTLYEKGLELYLRAEASEESTGLDVREKNLDERKKEVYSANLLEIDRVIRGFHENKTDLAAFIQTLAKIERPAAGSPVSLVLAEMENPEKDSADLDKEVLEMAGRVEKGNELNQKLQDFRTSQLSAVDFALWLKARNPEIRFSRNFDRALARHKRLRDLEGTSFFRELENYAGEVKAQLILTEEQKRLDQETHRLELLKKLLRLELSREEWSEIKGLKEESFPEAAAFYKNAEQREDALFRNLDPRENSVLVAGGFHAEGLTRRLKEKNISFALIRPEIASLPENCLYKDQMKGDLSWKSYFKAENGKINLYNAFIRATRDRLLDHDTNAVKEWRDEIIRDLSRQSRIEQASDYTAFLDEVADLRPSALKKIRQEWLANIDSFIEKFAKLQQEGRANENSVMDLLKPATIPTVTGAVAGRRSAIRAGLFQIRAGERPDVRRLRSESRSTFQNQLISFLDQVRRPVFQSVGVDSRQVTVESLNECIDCRLTPLVLYHALKAFYEQSPDRVRVELWQGSDIHLDMAFWIEVINPAEGVRFFIDPMAGRLNPAFLETMRLENISAAGSKDEIMDSMQMHRLDLILQVPEKEFPKLRRVQGIYEYLNHAVQEQFPPEAQQQEDLYQRLILWRHSVQTWSRAAGRIIYFDSMTPEQLRRTVESSDVAFAIKVVRYLALKMDLYGIPEHRSARRHEEDPDLKRFFNKDMVVLAERLHATLNFVDLKTSDRIIVPSMDQVKDEVNAAIGKLAATDAYYGKGQMTYGDLWPVLRKKLTQSQAAQFTWVIQKLGRRFQRSEKIKLAFAVDKLRVLSGAGHYLSVQMESLDTASEEKMRESLELANTVLQAFGEIIGSRETLSALVYAMPDSAPVEEEADRGLDSNTVEKLVPLTPEEVYGGPAQALRYIAEVLSRSLAENAHYSQPFERYSIAEADSFLQLLDRIMKSIAQSVQSDQYEEPTIDWLKQAISPIAERTVELYLQQFFGVDRSLSQVRLARKLASIRDFGEAAVSAATILDALDPEGTSDARHTLTDHLDRIAQKGFQEIGKISREGRSARQETASQILENHAQIRKSIIRSEAREGVILPKDLDQAVEGILKALREEKFSQAHQEIHKLEVQLGIATPEGDEVAGDRLTEIQEKSPKAARWLAFWAQAVDDTTQILTEYAAEEPMTTERLAELNARFETGDEELSAVLKETLEVISGKRTGTVIPFGMIDADLYALIEHLKKQDGFSITVAPPLYDLGDMPYYVITKNANTAEALVALFAAHHNKLDEELFSDRLAELLGYSGQEIARFIGSVSRPKNKVLDREVGDFWALPKYEGLKQLIMKYQKVPGMGALVQRLITFHTRGDTGSFNEAAGELFAADFLLENLKAQYDVQLRILGSSIGTREFDIALKIAPRFKYEIVLKVVPYVFFFFPLLGRFINFLIRYSVDYFSKDSFQLKEGLYFVEAKHEDNDSLPALISSTIKNQVSGQIPNLNLLHKFGAEVAGVIVIAGGIRSSRTPLKSEQNPLAEQTWRVDWERKLPVYSQIMPAFDVENGKVSKRDPSYGAPSPELIGFWRGDRIDILTVAKKKILDTPWPPKHEAASRAFAKLRHHEHVAREMARKESARKLRNQQRYLVQIAGLVDQGREMLKGQAEDADLEKALRDYYSRKIPLERLSAALRNVGREDGAAEAWKWLNADLTPETILKRSKPARVAPKPVVAEKEAPKRQVPNGEAANGQTQRRQKERGEKPAAKVRPLKDRIDSEVAGWKSVFAPLPEDVVRTYFETILQIEPDQQQKAVTLYARALRDKLNGMRGEKMTPAAVYEWMKSGVRDKSPQALRDEIAQQFPDYSRPRSESRSSHPGFISLRERASAFGLGTVIERYRDLFAENLVQDLDPQNAYTFFYGPSAAKHADYEDLGDIDLPTGEVGKFAVTSANKMYASGDLSSGLAVLLKELNIRNLKIVHGGLPDGTWKSPSVFLQYRVLSNLLGDLVMDLKRGKTIDQILRFYQDDVGKFNSHPISGLSHHLETVRYSRTAPYSITLVLSQWTGLMMKPATQFPQFIAALKKQQDMGLLPGGAVIQTRVKKRPYVAFPHAGLWGEGTTVKSAGIRIDSGPKGLKVRELVNNHDGSRDSIELEFQEGKIRVFKGHDRLASISTQNPLLVIGYHSNDNTFRFFLAPEAFKKLKRVLDKHKISPKTFYIEDYGTTGEQEGPEDFRARAESRSIAGDTPSGEAFGLTKDQIHEMVMRHKDFWDNGPIPGTLRVEEAIPYDEALDARIIGKRWEPGKYVRYKVLVVSYDYWLKDIDMKSQGGIVFILSEDNEVLGRSIVGLSPERYFGRQSSVSRGQILMERARTVLLLKGKRKIWDSDSDLSEAIRTMFVRMSRPDGLLKVTQVGDAFSLTPKDLNEDQSARQESRSAKSLLRRQAETILVEIIKKHQAGIVDMISETPDEGIETSSTWPLLTEYVEKISRKHHYAASENEERTRELIRYAREVKPVSFRETYEEKRIRRKKRYEVTIHLVLQGKRDEIKFLLPENGSPLDLTTRLFGDRILNAIYTFLKPGAKVFYPGGGAGDIPVVIAHIIGRGGKVVVPEINEADVEKSREVILSRSTASTDAYIDYHAGPFQTYQDGGEKFDVVAMNNPVLPLPSGWESRIMEKFLFSNFAGPTGREVRDALIKKGGRLLKPGGTLVYGDLDIFDGWQTSELLAASGFGSPEVQNGDTFALAGPEEEILSFGFLDEKKDLPLYRQYLASTVQGNPDGEVNEVTHYLMSVQRNENRIPDERSEVRSSPQETQSGGLLSGLKNYYQSLTLAAKASLWIVVAAILSLIGLLVYQKVRDYEVDKASDEIHAGKPDGRPREKVALLKQKGLEGNDRAVKHLLNLLNSEKKVALGPVNELQVDIFAALKEIHDQYPEKVSLESILEFNREVAKVYFLKRLTREEKFAFASQLLKSKAERPYTIRYIIDILANPDLDKAEEVRWVQLLKNYNDASNDIATRNMTISAFGILAKRNEELRQKLMETVVEGGPAALVAAAVLGANVGDQDETINFFTEMVKAEDDSLKKIGRRGLISILDSRRITITEQQRSRIQDALALLDENQGRQEVRSIPFRDPQNDFIQRAVAESGANGFVVLRPDPSDLLEPSRRTLDAELENALRENKAVVFDFRGLKAEYQTYYELITLFQAFGSRIANAFERTDTRQSLLVPELIREALKNALFHGSRYDLNAPIVLRVETGPQWDFSPTPITHIRIFDQAVEGFPAGIEAVKAQIEKKKLSGMGRFVEGLGSKMPEWKYEIEINPGEITQAHFERVFPERAEIRSIVLDSAAITTVAVALGPKDVRDTGLVPARNELRLAAQSLSDTALTAQDLRDILKGAVETTLGEMERRILEREAALAPFRSQVIADKKQKLLAFIDEMSGAKGVTLAVRIDEKNAYASRRAAEGYAAILKEYFQTRLAQLLISGEAEAVSRLIHSVRGIPARAENNLERAARTLDQDHLAVVLSGGEIRATGRLHPVGIRFDDAQGDDETALLARTVQVVYAVLLMENPGKADFIKRRLTEILFYYGTLDNSPEQMNVSDVFNGEVVSASKVKFLADAQASKLVSRAA